MTTRLRLLGLTALQMMMVIAGLVAYATIKQLYQRFVILPSVIGSLKDDIMGKERLWTDSLWVILPWVALPLVIIAGRNCASIFYRVGRMKRQIKRDAKAAVLLKRLQSEVHEPFSLYLRSFSQEENLKRKKGFWWYILIEGDIFGIDRETLDLMISSEVRHSYPMITFGRPGEKLGAGRLPASNPDWEALVLLLMKHAKAIFIVPNTSEGVIWEMERLKDYYEKTIYLMPPTKYYHGAAESAEQYWRETQQEFIHRGIFLPGYSKKGALFMLDEHGRVARSDSFKARFGGSRVRAFISLIGGESQHGLRGIGRSVISFVVSAFRIGRSLIRVVVSVFLILELGAMAWQYSAARNESPAGHMKPLGQNPSYKTVRYDKDGLSFLYHSTWKITEDKIIDGIARQILIDNEGDGGLLVILFPPELSLNLGDFAAKTAKERPSYLTAGTVSETRNLEVRRNFGGHSLQGLRQKFSASLFGETVPYTQDFFLVNTNEVNILITIYTPDEDWESAEKGFQVIFDSLSFKK